MQIKTPNLFNPGGNDLKETRQIWKGNSTNIIQLNNVKYNWAVNLYKKMRADFWIPEKVNLTQDTVDYNLLSKAEKRAYNGIISYLTFLDSIQVSNLGHIQSPLSAPEIKICLGEQQSQECFDEETEILTEDGWILFKDLPEYTKVASFDLTTNDIILEKPLRHIKRFFEGNLLHFKNDRQDILVTPNHEMITIHPRKGARKKKEAYLVKGGNYTFPTVAKNKIYQYDEVKTLDRLLIAIAADGSLRQFPDTTNCQIELGKPRKIERLEGFLKKLNIQFTKSLVKSTGNEKNYLPRYRFSFTLPTRITQEEVKALSFINPFNMSTECCRELALELTLWDGSSKKQDTRGRTWRCFYSTNKEAIDKCTILCFLGGLMSSVGVNRTAEDSVGNISPYGKPIKSAKTCYVVSISESVKTKYVNYKHQAYKGFVYCVTTTLGNIVTRRNGRIAITGNCNHTSSYQTLIESIVPVEERNGIYDFWRTDKVLEDRCKYIASLYQKYVDTRNEEDYFIALLANYLLEGLKFIAP